MISAFDLLNYDVAICAASEFSTAHDYYDPSNAIDGYVWHAPVGIAASGFLANNSAGETFLVRGSRGDSVPEPGMLGLFGLGLLGLGIARKRRTSKHVVRIYDLKVAPCTEGPPFFALVRMGNTKVYLIRSNRSALGQTGVYCGCGELWSRRQQASRVVLWTDYHADRMVVV